MIDSQYTWASLRSNIDQLMEFNSKNVDISKAKYWYPLAKPTYGVDEVLGALESMVSFKTSMWEKTALFEDNFSSTQGPGVEAIMVNSGSSADFLGAVSMLRESGGPLSRGDEILIPAVTWPTQVWAFLMAGFRVKLVDVDPLTLNVDFDDLTNKIGPATRAISIVHLLGNPVNLEKIMTIAETHGLLVHEDACESLNSESNGTRVGSNGWSGAFSTFFSHQMVTMEGGLVTTRDPDLAERFRLLRAHGWTRNLKRKLGGGEFEGRYRFESWGLNVRPTELQAAFGLVQLRKLPYFEVQRSKKVGVFLEGIASLSHHVRTMFVRPEDNAHWFALPIILQQDSPLTRDYLVEYLEKSGVETRPLVAGNIARQNATRNHEGSLESGFLPGADYLNERGLYVGLHPSETTADVERLLDVLESALKATLG